ncbi:hypothetical protein ABE83_21375 [Streptomyces sp. CFMR 7]|nr:DUF397 domain-containing protein [Streptomyces sp. CFMR 7]ALC29339.1 hypothetical protein ABE83_21375 [Streptomyces sp. CFMR 7]
MSKQAATQATTSMFDAVSWHKSTYSGSNNNCIEHAPLPSGLHAVRDTKDRSLGAHVFAPTAWQAFVTAVQDGSL